MMGEDVFVFFAPKCRKRLLCARAAGLSFSALLDARNTVCPLGIPALLSKYTNAGTFCNVKFSLNRLRYVLATINPNTFSSVSLNRPEK